MSTTDLSFIRDRVRRGKPIGSGRTADLLHIIAAADVLRDAAQALLAGPTAPRVAALRAAVAGYDASRVDEAPGTVDDNFDARR